MVGVVRQTESGHKGFKPGASEIKQGERLRLTYTNCLKGEVE